MNAPAIDIPTSTNRKAHRLAEGLTFRTTEYDGGDVCVEAVIYFDENCEADRDAWVAQFPKNNRLRINSCHGRDENYYANRPFSHTFVAVDKATGDELQGQHTETHARSAWILPMAEFQVRFTSTGVTGAKNEAGYKRLSSFLRNLDKLGIPWRHKQQKIRNTQPTIEDVLARFA